MTVKSKHKTITAAMVKYKAVELGVSMTEAKNMLEYQQLKLEFICASDFDELKEVIFKMMMLWEKQQ